MSTKKDTAGTPTEDAAEAEPKAGKESFLSGFMKKGTKKGTGIPKTYIMYKSDTDPEAYELVRAFRSKGIDVEALVFHLLKAAVVQEAQDKEEAKSEKAEPEKH